MSLTLQKSVLDKYRNPVFVETGSFEGGGIALALECGFARVYSIEIANRYYHMCQSKFGSNPKVKVYHGDSAQALPVILKEINAQITFWIDAHLPLDGAKSPGGWRNCPTMMELKAIAQHPIKTHTILIDDRFDFGTAFHDNITVDQLKEQLRAINPNYRFVYENGAKTDSVIVALS